MQKIKALVANRPRLMREMVLATISDQPDIEVVGVLEDEAVILESVEQAHPDFVIVALDESESNIRKEVLANETIAKWLDGKEPKKFIYVKGKMINVVV